MEHYRRLGFANEIRAFGMPGDHPTDVAYFTTYAGYELAGVEMPSANEAPARVRELAHVWNGAELPHRVPRSLVEQVLFPEPIFQIWPGRSTGRRGQSETGSGRRTRCSTRRLSALAQADYRSRWPDTQRQPPSTFVDAECSS